MSSEDDLCGSSIEGTAENLKWCRSSRGAVSSRQSIRWQPRTDVSVFPDYPAPDPQHRYRHRIDPDAVGDAATAAHWRTTGHEYPQHLIAALARLAEAGKPLHGPVQQLRRICARTEPGDEKEGRLVRTQ